MTELEGNSQQWMFITFTLYDKRCILHRWVTSLINPELASHVNHVFFVVILNGMSVARKGLLYQT